MSARKAQAMTAIAADFSRIRNAQLDRFTVDRLMTVLNRLDHRVRVQVPCATRRSGTAIGRARRLRSG